MTISGDISRRTGATVSARSPFQAASAPTGDTEETVSISSVATPATNPTSSAGGLTPGQKILTAGMLG